MKKDEIPQLAQTGRFTTEGTGSTEKAQSLGWYRSQPEAEPGISSFLSFSSVLPVPSVVKTNSAGQPGSIIGPKSPF